MPAARVIKAVDVFEYGDFNSAPGFPRMPPDQFRLDGFEESFHRCIVITIALATHGHFEAMLAQGFLVIVRAVLTASVRMVDAVPRRPAQGNSHV